MRHERYIVNEEEIALLDRYEGTVEAKKDPARYNNIPQEHLTMLCRLKDQNNELFFKRYTAAREVIDAIAEHIGINTNNTGFWLYSLDLDGTSPIIKRMEEWFSRSGEKAKLKRRITELEQENELLKRLLKNGG